MCCQGAWLCLALPHGRKPTPMSWGSTKEYGPWAQSATTEPQPRGSVLETAHGARRSSRVLSYHLGAG